MQILALVIGLVIGIAVGAVVAWSLARSRAGVDAAASRASAEALRTRLDEVRRDAEERLDAQDAQYRRQVDSLERRSAELEHLVQRMHGADSARNQNESKVLSALSPVAQTLDVMRTKIAELEQSRSEQYGALSAQLRSAAESEERLRATADTLASALSSNSTRGVWGETQLRNVVEAAGLLERVDFDVQSSVTTSAGTARPDMVVHLPGGKTIAVDAKVPFSAYLQAVEIPATATGAEGLGATRSSGSTSRRSARTSTPWPRASTGPGTTPPRAHRRLHPVRVPHLERPRRRPRPARPRLPQAHRPRLTRDPVVRAEDRRVLVAAGRRLARGARALPGLARTLRPTVHDGGTRRQARAFDPGLRRRLQPVRGVARAAGAAECTAVVAARRVEGDRGPGVDRGRAAVAHGAGAGGGGRRGLTVTPWIRPRQLR
ncbi:DNA recombination protein RmuC [Sphingomonas sp. LR61]